MGSNIFDLMGLALIGFGAYYLISGGKIPLIQQSATTQSLPTQPEEIIQQQQQDDGTIEGMSQNLMPSQQQQQQQQYYQPPPPPQPTPQQQRAMIAPPPGMVSSLDYIETPQYPPYVSPTVGTYSPYSPYNQFGAYQLYYTQPYGEFKPSPDDNITFTDIEAHKPGCDRCRYECMRNRYSYRCLACRPGCKTRVHYYTPPQQGWTIGPAPGGFSFLASVWDTITGEPRDTFADMDDYHRGRRFDCHNKLKRRVRPRDNRFVTAEDYYYSSSNPLNQDINVE